jgi:hypothetical protein
MAASLNTVSLVTRGLWRCARHRDPRDWTHCKRDLINCGAVVYTCTTVYLSNGTYLERWFALFMPLLLIYLVLKWIKYRWNLWKGGIANDGAVAYARLSNDLQNLQISRPVDKLGTGTSNKHHALKKRGSQSWVRARVMPAYTPHPAHRHLRSPLSARRPNERGKGSHTRYCPHKTTPQRDEPKPKRWDGHAGAARRGCPARSGETGLDTTPDELHWHAVRNQPLCPYRPWMAGGNSDAHVSEARERRIGRSATEIMDRVESKMHGL